MAKLNTDLKILFFDIETSMALGYFYGLYDQTISIHNIVEHPRMIAFTAKWYGKSKIHAFSEYHQSRKEMLGEMHRLLDEADMVVGWNSKRFDVKWVNSEFMAEGMKPPSPYKQVDLMTEVKRNARFISNKLDYVSDRLLGEKKIDYNMARMWVKVNDPNTDEAARKREWDAMMRYAKRDTHMLAPLFEELLPWIRMPHPARSTTDVLCCIACGSEKMHHRGRALTLSGSYERLWCSECGKWQRGKNREEDGRTREIS